MQIIELYIQGTKVDLFKDESVSITDSIQNVKDISKIFTAFSQQFNLPASKTNNRLFKHYHNYDINNSFDARFKVDAEIKLNGVTYKVGKIKLNEVSLKDNVPYSYKVVFFGDTIELKDLLGEDMLSELPIDSSLDFTYNFTNIKSKFESISDVIVPLITHSKRFQIANDGKYRDLDNNKLSFIDLKPALRVKEIINAIETNYDIDFSNEFFNSNIFTQLFIWLHRNEGFISNATEGGGLNTINNRFHVETSPEENYSLSLGSEQRPILFAQDAGEVFNQQVDCTMVIDALGNTDEYTVTVISSSGNLIYQETTSGDQTLTFSPAGGDENGLVNFNVSITSENTFNINHTLRVEHYGYESDDFGRVRVDFSDATYNAVSNEMPKMKVFDFLVNLFKMFNLTVYKEDGTIRVQPLNDFYNEGVKYDITEYVDMSKSSVSKLLQYKNIEFKFKSKKTQLVILSDELQGAEFSQEGYGNNDWDGGNYKIELDFEKMLYERLTDTHANPQVLTPITQGTFVDDKGSATIGKPLLFYPINTDAGDYDIEWNESGTSTVYNRPSQLDDTEQLAINFGLEADEHFREPRGSNLFERYYQDYVVSLFNIKGRKVKVSAYLPLHIILKYKLNDRFIIAGKSYRINTIKTNLLTNKSDLELINDLVSVSDLEDGININATRVTDLVTTSKNTNRIETSWSAVSGAAGYNVYLDDVNLGFITGTTNAFTGLDSGITYKLGVQAVYKDALDVIVYNSLITNLFDTTD
jgi:hypothetical protein